MSLSKEIVEYIARLSALELTEDEVLQMQTDLSSTLDLVAALSAIDTSGISPTLHVHGAVNAFREDLASQSFSVEEVGLNAPDFMSASFRVPKVI